MIVNQYIVSDSKRFVLNIKNLLPSNIKSFSIIQFDMVKKPGISQYAFELKIKVNNIKYILTFRTNSFNTYEYFNNSKVKNYPKRTLERWIKTQVLFILNAPIIKDQLKEV